MNQSEYTEEIKTFPLNPHLLQGQQALHNCKPISVMQDTWHLCLHPTTSPITDQIAIKLLTHCILNRLSHTIYWKSLISILGTSGYEIYIFLEKNGLTICKQWRPWSDVAFCGVWSESALFANYPFTGLPTTLGNNYRVVLRHINWKYNELDPVLFVSVEVLWPSEHLRSCWAG